MQRGNIDQVNTTVHQLFGNLFTVTYYVYIYSCHLIIYFSTAGLWHLFLSSADTQVAHVPVPPHDRCYNAYVLFTIVDPSWNSSKCFRRCLFLEEVARALTDPTMAKRSYLTRGPSKASPVLQAREQVHDQKDKEEEPHPGP